MIEFRLADDVTPNFHQGLIAYRERTVAVACTRDSAVLALAGACHDFCVSQR